MELGAQPWAKDLWVDEQKDVLGTHSGGKP